MKLEEIKNKTNEAASYLVAALESEQSEFRPFLATFFSVSYAIQRDAVGSIPTRASTSLPFNAEATNFLGHGGFARSRRSAFPQSV
jgi:hypothetical protein